jgi:O-antigen/teichoic acid export membrane protein
MSSLENNGFYTVLVQIPTQILGVTAGIFITRMLGPEGRGEYALFMANVGLIYTILGFSISNPIIHFKASGRLSDSRLVSVTIVYTILTLILSLLIVYVLMERGYLPKASDKYFYGYYMYFMIFVCLQHFNNILSSMFRGAKSFALVNRVLLLNGLIQAAAFAFVFFIQNFRDNVEIQSILKIIAVVSTINVIQWIVKINRVLSAIELTIRADDIKRFSEYMGIGHASNIVSFLNGKLVLWVVALYLDNFDVGIFSLALGLTQLLSFISTPLSQVLLPHISSADGVEARRMFTLFARMNFTVLIIMGVLSAAFAGLVIPIVYGDEFKQSTIPFIILIVGAVFSGQVKIFATLLYSSGLVAYNLYTSLFGLMLAATLNIVLIKAYGVIGAAIAQSLAAIFTFAFIFAVACKKTSLSSLNLFLASKTDLINAWKKI